MIITDEDINENAIMRIGELLITRESFACENGHYNLTCQFENTISSAFTLLQSNNPLLIQNQAISKVGVGKQECLVREGGGCPPCPTVSYGPEFNV